MFDPSDFELPLEKELHMQIVNKEIDSCSDIQALRENLKQCAESLMTYQHLLNVVLKKQIENDLGMWSDKIVEEVNKMMNDGST